MLSTVLRSLYRTNGDTIAKLLNSKYGVNLSLGWDLDGIEDMSHNDIQALLEEEFGSNVMYFNTEGTYNDIKAHFNGNIFELLALTVENGAYDAIAVLDTDQETARWFDEIISLRQSNYNKFLSYVNSAKNHTLSKVAHPRRVRI